MEYNKIIAVTGMPGLYELLSSKADGAIVRSLDDKSTKFVSSRIHNFSHLESIEIYTVRDNVNLVDILKAMEGSSEKLPGDKDPKDLKNYFTKVYPDLDFDRVYSSDLKKMVKWYSVLKSNKVEIKLSEVPAEEEVAAEEPAAKPVAAEKKAAAAAPAKAKETKEVKETKESKEVKKEAKEEKEEAKAKKPAAKKKAAPEAKEKPAAEKPKKAAPKKKS